MEPWKYKEDDDRTEDGLILFLLFCEDEVSEPVYFKFFETPKIKVNTIGKQRSKMEHVIKALTHCYEENYMETKEGEDCLKPEFTQVWCIFDRDDSGIQAQQGAEATSFNESIIMAERRGLKVAWSNDAFELWVLLHFEDVDFQNGDHRRSFYYDRLTQIFKDMPDKSPELQKMLEYPKINYKDDFKREKHFRNVVRPCLIPLTERAIERAAALEQLNLANPGKRYHERIPCTMVHMLVQELLAVGGKEI